MKELNISVAAEVIAHVGGIGITNSLLTAILVMLLLILIAIKVRSVKPAKRQSGIF
jgi:hypothetical protein